MEISPIPGIRSLPVMKVPPAESDLSRVFDIDNSSKPNDDTYSGSNKKGTGGQDDESDIVEDSALDSEARPAQPDEETDRGLAVNFFA
jgi:hypothetical protein